MSVLLVAVVSFAAVAMPASATSSQISDIASTELSSEDELDRLLLQKGFPRELLVNLPSDAKQDMVESGGTHAGHKLEYLSISEKDSSSPDEAIRPLWLNDHNFTHSLTFTNNGVKNGERYYTYYYNWLWEDQPRFAFMDKIGLAWTDGWAADPNTAQISYTPKGWDPWYGKWVERTYTRTGFEHWQSKVGIGWEFDIVRSFPKDGHTITTWEHRGWAKVTVRKPLETQSRLERTQVVGQYFHKQVTVSSSFGFDVKDGTPSFTITPTWAYHLSRPVVTEYAWWTR